MITSAKQQGSRLNFIQKEKLRNESNLPFTILEIRQSLNNIMNSTPPRAPSLFLCLVKMKHSCQELRVFVSSATNESCNSSYCTNNICGRNVSEVKSNQN